MGLLSKLFGKKEKEQAEAPVPASSQSSPMSSADAVSSFIQNVNSRVSLPAQDEDIESAIAKNPYSSLYRLPSPQTNLELSTLDYLPFYIKSKGRFVALDLETTGLSCDSDRIVEICAVRVEYGRITDTYHQYVNPEIRISSSASSVNHITNDMVCNQPKIYEVLPDLLHFIGSDIIVAHNAAFDIRFLARSCMRYRFIIPLDWFDSMDLQIVWPDLPNHKLQTFLDAAGIENKNAHSALGDAEALARLMIVSMQQPFIAPIPEDIILPFSTGHFSGSVEKIDSSLSGKRFVLTGEIIGHERYDVEELIARHGGKATLKISDATDYLVRGVYQGLPSVYISSKEVYARKLISEGGKIRIISPEELFAMMNEVL